MRSIKKLFLFLTYVWLRLDPILRITFGRNWLPRYEFMASIFGEKASEEFLQGRVEIVKAREKEKAACILPSDVDKQVSLFLKVNLNTKKGRQERTEIIGILTNWALDPDINAQNIDSHKTRSNIVNSLLGSIFQNSLIDEMELSLTGLKKIVFSRVTYLGSKGEPSPIVHDAIISGVGRILRTHFDEVARLREEKLEELTKIKLIKEIKKDDQNTGSLAFSGSTKHRNQYCNKFPLPTETTKMLLDILMHYQYSAWPESRNTAIKLIDIMEKRLGFKLKDSIKDY
ncbi:hypothetical protein KJ707_03495 [Patescibacteria group bacterium]|nr:hypothetical protein [Patescibacteria group bacterium]MBU1966812.1 hypothetical protein [Patescibacteria group bacterium]MBU2543598.1 hypothetical protein [Patescibacteria group bacterium]